MSALVISVEGVGKKYRLGTPSGTDRLSEVMVGLGRAAAHVPMSLVRRLRRRSSEAAPAGGVGRGEFWALRDVSFEVRRGETVGVVGRNGAGKSTLLKVLSRITAPTIGRFGVRGRVASLLEVGTGFHGELTGRENIFLSGTLLGMSRQEIQKRLDEIVAFAEVDRFLDTPVKRYSSGMQMRLGFAVAAHLEADILIVDEVLAVGDAEFQKKCLGKMGEVAKGGRTVLFVSHNMGSIESLCGRVLLLDSGRILDAGSAGSVVQKYLHRLGRELSEYRADLTEITAQGKLALTRVRVGPEDSRTDGIRVDRPIRVELEVWNPVPGVRLNFSVNVWTAQGVLLFNTYSPSRVTGRDVFSAQLCIPPDVLNCGLHSIEVMVVSATDGILLDAADVVTFTVLEPLAGDGVYETRVGLIRPRVTWQVG